MISPNKPAKMYTQRFCIPTVLVFTLSALLFLFTACRQGPETAQESQSLSERLIERAARFELDTEYVPPPGDPLSHHASGFAKILCSAVFVTGLEADFAAENLGYFSAPYEERSKMAGYEVDGENEQVHVRLPDGTVRTAAYLGDQGCVTYPEGTEMLHFTPTAVTSALPAADRTVWPMGDLEPDEPLPTGADMDLVSDAVDAAFEPAEAQTAAFLVTWKGRIVGERYGAGISKETPLESWSMGKSLTAAMLGLFETDGTYDLMQPAPVPEWQGEGDPRAEIRIADILRMSSGLRFRAPQDPDFDPSLGYPDHLFVYTGGINAFDWAATRPLQWPPNTVGRYRNSDPVLINYLIRLAVEERGDDYLSFPQQALFDRIGIRNMVLETDPYGNFLTQGYELGSARDWARLGMLFLNDGMWMGERIMTEELVRFVQTPAPAWVADGNPVYGGFFWLNTDAAYPVPEDTYFMAGAGGQRTLIIPSHDLVVVRLGHYKGAAAGDEALKRALERLIQAIPHSSE